MIGAFRERTAAVAWGTVLAGAVAVFVAIAWGTLRYPHEVAVSEGAVGLAAESLLRGVGLYDPIRWTQPPYVIVHYTPLYYLLTAAAQEILGGGFLAGRLVSVAFTLATAAAAAFTAAFLTRRASTAVVAAALWLSFYQVAFWGTIQRVDAPGIFLEAVGIAVYLRAREAGRSALPALAWFVGAWLTKQVMVVGLLAATIDLFRDRRDTAVRFGLVGFGSIAALFGALTLWSGGGFWTATVLGTVSRHADPPWVIFSNSELFFGSPWNMTLLLAAAAAAFLRPKHRFLGIYLVTGMLLAIATDANLPRFFPPMLAMALLVALLLDDLRSSPPLRAAALAGLALVGASHVAYEMRPLVRERVLSLTPDNPRLRFAELTRRHTTGREPVLAQDVGMLLSAGRPVTMADPLVFSILVGNGAWSPEALARGLRERRYEAVILNRPIEAVTDTEWTTLWISGPARRAVQEHYRLAETLTIDASWRFLEPTRYVYVRKETP